MSNTKVVLAVDPGSNKCGLALVERDASGDQKLLWRTICPVETLGEAYQEAVKIKSLSLVIVGNGTKSKDVVHILRELNPSIGILLVDEHETTMQARERYWEHHNRRGWRRFIPATLQVPPEPVDDFVALILAERVLSD